MTLRERLEAFRATLKLTQEDFAGIAGISHDTYKKMKNPTYEALQQILSAYPNLSAEWLMRGTGDMIKHTIRVSPEEPVHVNIPKEGSKMYDIIDSMNPNAMDVHEELATLKRQNSSLRRAVESLTELIKPC